MKVTSFIIDYVIMLPIVFLNKKNHPKIIRVVLNIILIPWIVICVGVFGIPILLIILIELSIELLKDC